MYNKIDEGEVLTVEIVKSVLKYEFPHVEVESVLSSDSEFNHKLKVNGCIDAGYIYCLLI